MSGPREQTFYAIGEKGVNTGILRGRFEKERFIHGIANDAAPGRAANGFINPVPFASRGT
jgi:hypothetical protein